MKFAVEQLSISSSGRGGFH